MSDFKKYLNVYEFEVVLPGCGQTVKFKPITTGQLKILLVYENETNEMIIEEALDSLISSSVISDGFDIKTLYLQDRFFLLIEIRKKTKGELYKFSNRCDKCGSETLQNINLNDLKVTHLNKDIDNNIKLTDNLSVKLNHINRGGQIEAYKYFDGANMTPLQQITEMSLLTHAAGIKSIRTPESEDLDLSINDKKYLLENIPTGLYEMIKDWYVNNNFGIDFTFNISCHTCDNNEEVSIPLNNFFF